MACGANTVSKTFVIQNTGTSVLNITGISIGGTHATDFTLGTVPTTVAGNSNQSFVITFDASVAGNRTATVSISSNDTDENPYTFAINGNGIDREINVLGNSVSITDGDTSPDASDNTNFGNTALPKTMSYTIQNTGTEVLTISSITSSNTADFTITGTVPTSVAAGGNATFDVTFTPSTLGLKTATITVNNDDCDEATFDFAVQATVIVAPTQPVGNRGLYFDGVDDYVNIGTSSKINFSGSDNFTIEMWIKSNGTGGMLFDKVPLFPSLPNTLGIWTQIDASGILSFHLGKEGTGWDFLSTTDPVQTNRWTHVTFEKQGSTSRIYIDGILKASRNLPNSSTAIADASPANLGRFRREPAFKYFGGQIDEFRLSNNSRYGGAAFTPQESYTVDLNTILYYPMNEGTGQTVADASANPLIASLGETTAAETPIDPLWALRVKNVNNTGSESIVEVITQSNALAGRNYVDFSIDNTTPTVRTIALTGALNVTEQVLINGYSAFGSDTELRIDINGNTNNIFNFNSNNSTLQGLIMRDAGSAVNVNAANNGNKISRNSIFNNTVGINLNSTGNGGKVAPVITSATISLISGTCATCVDGEVIELFRDNLTTPTANKQGKEYLGTATVTSNAWSMAAPFTMTLSLGDFITATATNITSNNTSPFFDGFSYRRYYLRDNYTYYLLYRFDNYYSFHNWRSI